MQTVLPCRVTYYLEFLAPKFRGICIVLMALWWSVGSILAAALALAIIPNCTLLIVFVLNYTIGICVCSIPRLELEDISVFMCCTNRYSDNWIPCKKKIARKIPQQIYNLVTCCTVYARVCKVLSVDW